MIERVRWLEADSWLRTHGNVLTLRDDKGQVKNMIPAPQLAIAQKAQDRAIKLGKEFLYKEDEDIFGVEVP